ncbi:MULTISPECIES: response regulator transcription factor [Azorhizobium]|uniref:response regulator transcription factor n=1 Tax=Azorhizobium TaxID=6 RepID=UPI00105D6B0C|nr:response regulator transcription factor [Azorhizobium sp. AG788]TDT89538.1 two-component system torCAD operon response regulator TorR [Azorhizobium sp. AG788]
MSATVLIVEDAPESLEMISTFLEENGMRTVRAASGAELKSRLQSVQPDIILLDVNLPDADGIALARQLRLGASFGLIFVTARDSDEDVLAGLDAGGDDYVTKPINPRTLLARIRSVLRRAREPVITFDGWILDVVRRELFRPTGQLVELTAGEFNILVALASRPQEPLSRDFLLDVISNRDPREISSHTVDNLIARLRKKMTHEGLLPPIATVRGVGYALMPTPPR